MFQLLQDSSANTTVGVLSGVVTNDSVRVLTLLLQSRMLYCSCNPIHYMFACVSNTMLNGLHNFTDY